MKRVLVLHSRTQVGTKGDFIFVNDDEYKSLISKGLVEDAEKEVEVEMESIDDQEGQESGVSGGTDEG